MILKTYSTTTQNNFNCRKMSLGISDVVKRTIRAAESFAHLLEQTGALDTAFQLLDAYNPLFLDNPALKAIRHKTIITLPCFLGTILQPSKPQELKLELNDHWKETHPTVDPTLTLSQIRNLKTRLLDVGVSQVKHS